MKEIPLTQGYVALVDDEDFEIAGALKWSLKGHHSQPPRAQKNTIGRLPIELGQFLLRPETGIVTRLEITPNDPTVPLDYRRSNLVVWPTAALSIHRHKKRTTRFGWHGICVDKRGRFYAQAGGKYLGAFPTAEDAARAYDRAVYAKFGTFARLNFPEEVVAA